MKVTAQRIKLMNLKFKHVSMENNKRIIHYQVETAMEAGSTHHQHTQQKKKSLHSLNLKKKMTKDQKMN